jgi:hypothetical protein
MPTNTNNVNKTRAFLHTTVHFNYKYNTCIAVCAKLRYALLLEHSSKLVNKKFIFI